MKSSSCLLLLAGMCKRLKKKKLLERANYQKKIKKIYLAYLAMYYMEKEKKTRVIRRKMWTRSLYTADKMLMYGCGTELFSELERDTSKFYNYFRMNRNMFFEMLDFVKAKIEKQDVVRKPIDPKTRLALTLRYLASGDSMKSISYAFRVSPQAVSKIISETCEAIWSCLNETFLKKPTEEDWRDIANDFEIKWDFPHCIGAVDGKHIVIQAPPNSGSAYFNYKNTHSVILMAVVDANLSFVLVDIGAQGRKSDSGVFRTSNIGIGFEENLLNVPNPSPLRKDNKLILPYTLVGDEAFALTNYLMRPYPKSGTLNIRKKIFNYRLSRARRTVECAFGLLRGRWRIFAKPIIASMETTQKIIQATICLHNFILKRESVIPANDSILNSSFEETAGMKNVGRTGSNAYSRNAANFREKLAAYFETTGAVPWQWERAENYQF